jgi:hypothetical protein
MPMHDGRGSWILSACFALACNSSVEIASGEPCTFSSDCRSKNCLMGFCPDRPELSICAGDPCNTEGSCPEGELCTTIQGSGNKVCVPTAACGGSKKPGETCATALQCASGVCVGYQCPSGGSNVTACGGDDCSGASCGNDGMCIKLQSGKSVCLPTAVCGSSAGDSGSANGTSPATDGAAAGG